MLSKESREQVRRRSDGRSDRPIDLSVRGDAESFPAWRMHP